MSSCTSMLTSNPYFSAPPRLTTLALAHFLTLFFSMVPRYYDNEKSSLEWTNSMVQVIIHHAGFLTFLPGKDLQCSTVTQTTYPD